MKSRLLSIVSASLLFISLGSAMAQDEGFMYGKVTTFDKQEYEGPIRWGKEELYWVDVFNASKEENENLRYLNKVDKEKLLSRGKEVDNSKNDDCCKTKYRSYGIATNGFGGGIYFNNGRLSNNFTHQFSCQFGDIKSIKPKRNNDAEIEMQGGTKVVVSGEGFNDIGTEIKVIDKEIGEIELNWNRIEKIEFKNTPAKLERKFGSPLFGTVETYQGQFTGAIQWDKEERISEDKLDGDMEDGKVAVSFGSIKSIERFQNRSRVVLKSGRELDISGSNDVNRENRGIVVTQNNGLVVTIPWSEFKRINYTSAELNVFKKYDDFKNQKAISATILENNGKSSSGKTIFDLDEENDFELFEGQLNDIEYSIAFRNIKKIQAKDEDQVEVTLKTNEKLTLAESQDVSRLNQGLLVFKSKEIPTYFPWKTVKEINLD